MDNETYRVAIASSDGIVVNSHFGKAEIFHIYDVNDNGDIKYVEERRTEPVCNGGNHTENRLKENFEKLRDCRYLLVSRIGGGAAAVAEDMGIIPMELAGVIEESISELIKYRKLQDLFNEYGQ